MAGQIVLVIGGTGGIGRATAVGLARLGAHVAVTGRDSIRADDAVREIRGAGTGQVDVFIADLSSQAQVRGVAAQALDALRRIDFEDLQGERSYSGGSSAPRPLPTRSPTPTPTRAPSRC